VEASQGWPRGGTIAAKKQLNGEILKGKIAAHVKRTPVSEDKRRMLRAGIRES